MKPEQMLAICKNRTNVGWDGMKRIINSQSKHEYQILASAVMELYHPNPTTGVMFGLTRWDELLDAHTKFLKGIARINLRDFYHAWQLAETELKDSKVAARIGDYISEHRKKLYNVFKPGRLDLGEQIDLRSNLAVLEFNHNIKKKF